LGDLERHFTIEEERFFPVVRELDPGLVDALVREHAEIRKRLSAWEGVDPAVHRYFQENLASLREGVGRHFATEERKLLARLGDVLTDPEQDELGRRLLNASS